MPPDSSVVWDTPGKDCRDSMPIGNGDLGLNLWTEENGDIVFLIGKTDAWTENGQLVKLGRVRVQMDPSPFTKSAAFRQTLQTRAGEIELRGEGGTVLHAWVDANAPVIHLESRGNRPVSMRAAVELWRTEPRKILSSAKELKWGFRELYGNPEGSLVIEPDIVLPARNQQIIWLHHNSRSIYSSTFENQHLENVLGKYDDPLLNLNFGVMMKGPGLAATDDRTLKSTAPQSGFRLDLYVVTNRSERVADWKDSLDQAVSKIDSIELESARRAHHQWWDQFWSRSWIQVTGDDNADKVTQGYAMQRWMTASSGRGAMPLKFNGGIFTVGQEPPHDTPYNPANGHSQNPDYRTWGSNYWFQNQRLLYWPMIAAGDFDMLAPFFNMYRQALPLAKERTKLYFKHDGAVFPETLFFWGLPNNNDFGWGNQGPIMKSTWIRYHVNNGLELTTMMLDCYEATQDVNFARNTLMPLASELVTYFDQHFTRGNGKIRFEPSAALETRQSAVNPAQDIAGLIYVLPRLLALPKELASLAQRDQWKRLLAELPPLPRGRTDVSGKQPLTPEASSADGKEILWPAEKFSKPGNCENPELYSVFPYRIFGVNQPELALAKATYDAKIYKSSTCWGQDGIQAACLGWADRAKAEVIANFTAYGCERFKWFWKSGHDWEPDFDNGGVGQIILQSMLMQVRGDVVLLFPAWPKEWNVDFRLHAPKNTVIQGRYRNGKLEQFQVTPPERAKNVIHLTPLGAGDP